MPPGRLIARLGLVLLACATTAQAGSVTARVRFVTARRAYLTVGRLEKLGLGQTITLTRNGRAIGSCAVDHIGDHEASCPSTNARAGDTFVLPAPPPPPPAPELPPLRPASLPPQDQAQVTQVLADAPVEVVEYKAAGRKLTQSGASLLTGSIGHNAFMTFGGSSFQQTRLELQLNGLDAHWAGFRVYAHLTALLSSVMPPEQRFRNGDVAQIYVWEAAFSSRELGRPFVVSVGRIWPYHTPGLALLDGAQLGWRRKDGLLEAGVYGGVIPDPMTLYPSGQRYAAGVYYGHTLTRAGGLLRVLQTEGRLGVRGASKPGLQLELEWALMMTLGSWFDMGVQARASIGAGQWTVPSFDSARAFVGLRPHRTVRMTLTYRYFDQRGDYEDLLATLFDRRSQHNATFQLGWDPRPWIGVALIAGMDSAGFDANATRAYVGPELSFPTLLARRGGLSVGYREELGWFVGRNVYAQLSGAIGNRFTAFGRLSYFEDRASGGTTDIPHREIGMYLYGEGRILRWLSARLSTLLRISADPNNEGAPTPAGLVLRAELIGRL